MLSGRGTLARFAVLFLALYTVVDIATPFLPGAFRFDAHSIEVGGRAGGTVGVVDAAVSASPVRVVRRDSVAAPRPARRPASAPSRISDAPRPARADSPPDASEDD
jgi:hypothetical protein